MKPLMNIDKTLLKDQSPRRRYKVNAAYLFILPYSLALLTFGVIPVLYAVVISFSTIYRGKPQFFSAGLSNFVTAFSDFRFANVFSNMGTYLILVLPAAVIGVVILSLLLHTNPGKLSTSLRTLYFVAGAVTGPALVLLSIFMFDPQISPFRPLLHTLGFEVFNDVLFRENLPVVFALMHFFSIAGGWIAIFFGGLQGISAEVLEAATVDGCNAWQKAIYIKMPLIKSYIFYMAILVFAGSVQLFAEPQLIGSAVVDGSIGIWSPNQLNYEFAFGLGNFGASAALSLVLLLIGLVAAYIIITKTNFYSID